MGHSSRALQTDDRHAPDDDARESAEQRQRDGFDEELRADVAPRAPMAMRMPISRVRSVTLTSMMFMTPMPPTTRLMAATPMSRTVMRPKTCACSSAISFCVVDLEVGSRARRRCGGAAAGWRRSVARRGRSSRARSPTP